MRVAAIQLNSTADKPANLAAAERLVRAAAEDGAELIGLPEKWNVLGAPEELRAGAEPLDGPTLTAVASWARELGVAVLAGSIPERDPDGETLHNTSVLVDSSGEQLAAYRKIHMFDVDVEGVSYRESETEQAGEDLVGATVSVGSEDLEVGLSICYDVRFPELYRILAIGGARLLAVPAAFTVPTGQAHWEVLLRARAIENQAFVLAPGQVGAAPPHYDSWGHSMIVDPWGRILAEAGPGEGFVAADLDLAEQERVRGELPSLANRRPHSYRWPELVRSRD
jgi:deaminated glutathione amidase